jgi:zinc transport system substrate-binding protein
MIHPVYRGAATALLAVVLIAMALPAATGDKLVVYTVNYPLYYFTARIAGDAAEVVFPVPADIDPAFWMPGPEEIAAFQKADLILLNGAGYAKWISKAALSEYRMVNTSESFSDRYIKTPGSVTHSHGPRGEHSHSGIAITTWLDPTLATIQAKTIYDALLKKIPDKEKELSKRFELLKKDLIWLDSELEMVVARKQGMPLIASHPVYQYFGSRYGLNLESVMWEPGEYPSDELWSQIEYGLESHKAKWMIWEAEPIEKSVKRLESLGVGSIVFAPCGNRPEHGDYLSVMKANVENLKKAYE